MSMNLADVPDFLQKISRLKRKIKTKQDELDQLENGLDKIQRKCQHDWSKSTKQSKYYPGYTIPGDPPGTMGVDWRGPCDVPSETKVWYERTCNKCGLNQRTEKTKPVGFEADFGS